MALHYFTVATFNAKNLVRPGVTYYGRNKYSATGYNQKLEWMAEQLFRMDADFVCLQEIFHPEPLEELAERYNSLLAKRYSKTKARRDSFDSLWHLGNENGTDEDPSPGLGLLSRRKLRECVSVQDLGDNPIEIEESEGLSYRLERLSRPLMMAKVDLGKGVDGWIFNSHLKSKRPLYPDGSRAGQERNYLFQERAEASFRSLALRAGEALTLRREVLAKLDGTTEPVFVVGDLNDEGGAVTTEMVRGEAPWRGWKFDVKTRFWDVELYSAVKAHLRRSEHNSIYTHIYNGHYGTIDHIFVSQEFYYRNPRRIGDINFVQCFNDHLTDDSIRGAPPLGPASDHAQLAVRMSIDPDRMG